MGSRCKSVIETIILSTDSARNTILIDAYASGVALGRHGRMANFLNNILFIFQRLNWLSLLDILLVTLIFFVVLYSLRDTQAMVLLRGVIFLVVALILLTTLVDLPAFSWLIKNTLPALLLAIPVIFAPEIRRALERLGRCSASGGSPAPGAGAGAAPFA